MSTARELQIYAEHVEDYDALVSAEDADGNLQGLLSAIPLAECDVLELGAGTGRLTRLLREARSLTVTDASHPMLDFLASQLPDAQITAVCAQHSQLDLQERSLDLIVGGWTVCYAFHSAGEVGLRTLLTQLKHALRPGGSAIFFENYGTGSAEPSPPEKLKPYFAILKEEGFSSEVIRTDYAFADPAEALRLTRFFFGEELAEQVERSPSARIREWTAVWRWTHSPDAAVG